MADEVDAADAHGVAVREMTTADLGAVRALSEQLGYPVTLEALQRRFARIHHDPEQAAFVASRAGEVVGWIHVAPQWRLESEPYAEIAGLVVDARVRRSGVGRSLVARAELWAREHGFARVRVRSNAARGEAHLFYPGVGYERVKTQHVYEK